MENQQAQSCRARSSCPDRSPGIASSRVNSATATARPDGSIRVIVAHADPKLPNWIETIGHRFGTMCFRWVRPEMPEGVEPPIPTCRVVKHAELASLAR